MDPADPILILASRREVHADLLVQALERRGARPIRFDIGDFPRKCRLAYHASNDGWRGELDLGRRTLPLDRVPAAWLGRPGRVQVDPALGPVARRFARSESRAVIEGALHLENAFWVNHPDRVLAGERKLTQLRKATALGFEIPETLVTNDPEEARRFFDRCGGDMIYKPIGEPRVHDGSRPPELVETLGETAPDRHRGTLGLVYTSRVSAQDLDDAGSLQHSASLFQENVAKQTELRVTVVGHRVFTVEIHSQETESTRQDWRRYELDRTFHGIHELDAGMAQKCVDLTRDMGLAYGAIDLILTPDGRHVFLEINPVGLWYWLEELTGLPITDAVADLLVAGRVEARRADVQTRPRAA